MSKENDVIVKISELFAEVNIPSVVVGASARDIFCEIYGLPKAIRKTTDVDFGIFVKSWDELRKVEDHLKNHKNVVKKGEKDNKVRYHYDGIPFDIVPFGGVEEGHQVSWPPFYDTIMTVLGYEEALKHSIPVKIKETEIKVVTVEILIALKLIAWDENSSREKDIFDSWFLIKNYSKIDPTSYEYILENYLALLERFDHEAEIAEPLHIGIKLKSLLKQETLTLVQNILGNEDKLDQIAVVATREQITDRDEQMKIVLKYFKAISTALS